MKSLRSTGLPGLVYTEPSKRLPFFQIGISSKTEDLRKIGISELSVKI